MFGLFGGAPSFDPAKDIPSLAGKVILVTGGNVGLGRQSILELSRHGPSHIWLAARNAQKAADAITWVKDSLKGSSSSSGDAAAPVAEPNITAVDLDLTSFDSIRQAAATVRKSGETIDILMLNAGVMATPAGLTKEGYELQFGTNHVGHALLTKLLMPSMHGGSGGDQLSSKEGGPKTRVVVLSSMGNAMAPSPGIDFDSLRQEAPFSTSWTRYGQSKLANILFARGLAKRYPDRIEALSVHPGVVNTNLYAPSTQGNILYRTSWAVISRFVTGIEEGALNQLWAATAPKEQFVNGEYYVPVAKHGTKGRMGDDALADRLWDWTEKEIKDIEL